MKTTVLAMIVAAMAFGYLGLSRWHESSNLSDANSVRTESPCAVKECSPQDPVRDRPETVVRNRGSTFPEAAVQNTLNPEELAHAPTTHDRALSQDAATIPAKSPTMTPKRTTVPREEAANSRGRIRQAQRMDLDTSDALPALMADPDPEVRVAAFDQARQLEAEYETANRIERHPTDSGSLASAVSDAISAETDPFALASSLGYLAEYGGRNEQTQTALEDLLARDDLPGQTLADIAEQLVEGQGRDTAEVADLVLLSPSTDNMPEEMRAGLEETVKGFVPVLLEEGPDTLEPGLAESSPR